MLPFKSIVVITALFFVTACASNPQITSLSSEQRVRLNKIQVLRGGVEKPYQIIGVVKGLSCQRDLHSKRAISEQEAIEGARIEATILGADAVINATCQTNSTTDWENNCYSSIICVGDAIK